MAKTIICARHGRTSNVIETAVGPVCGEPRKAVDRNHPSPHPDKVKLRKALALPDDVCGREALEECAGCQHPAHAGRPCSTMLSTDNDGTKWCVCGTR